LCGIGNPRTALASTRPAVNAAGRFDNSTATELAQIYATAFLFQETPRGFTDIACGTFTIGPYFEDLLATEVWDFFTASVNKSLTQQPACPEQLELRAAF
jgi:hypothetical protein